MKKTCLGLLLLVFLLPGHLLAQCVVEDIDVGESVAGSWDNSCDSENQAGSYARYYTFTVAQSQEFTIDLASSVDTYLFLLEGDGTDGAEIESNDDISVSNSNSNITIVLPPGDYTIEATTFSAAATGNFNVSVVSTTTPAEECENILELNTTQPGTWEPDCTSTNREGAYARYYTFVLPIADLVVIDLTSSADNYMYLLAGSGMDGAILEVDDNDGPGSNSRITVLLNAGSYTIEATTRDSSTTGDFTIRVTADEIPPAGSCENLIAVNTKTAGVWEPACVSINRPGRYARYYTFDLLSEQVVTIGLDSARDSYMFLLEGAGKDGDVIDQNDDGGGSDNAEISLTLEAGTYTIEATTYAASVEGSFSLTLDAAPPGCDDCPFEFNAGLNDAWFNPATNGQGMNITVYPIIKQVFVTWFTFDTERPPPDVTAMLGGPGQRWMTAQGPYDGDTATLTIYITEGGEFDSATPPATTDQDGDGTLTLEVSGCNAILASYDITSLDISDEIPLERIVLDNVGLCEMLAEP